MEEKVAQTLLEEPTTVTIGGEAYQVAPPSIFTLVRASKYISKIPTDTIDEGNVLGSIIHNAEEYENIAWAISVILLGKDFTEIVTYPKWQFWRKKRNVTKGELLAKKLINTPITEVSAAFFNMLAQMDIRPFFVITTSLKGMMITKPTKEVENEMTASGDL